MKPIEEQTSSRICTLCNKGFTSGKVLGGHMRMHFQTHKKKVMRSESKMKNLRNSSDANSSSLICYVCGKNFSSMKSLFGHMRSHPERGWRGIRPPHTRVENSSSSTVFDDLPQKFDDRTDSAVTTRSTVISGSWSHDSYGSVDTGFIACESMEERRMHEAVSDLMLLAQGCQLEANKNEIRGSQQELDHVQLIVDGGSNFPKENCTNIDVAALKIDLSAEALVKTMTELRDVVKNEKTDNEGIRKMPKRKKKRKMKSIRLEVANNHDQSHKQSPISSYKCSLCGKKFLNHQALGGHRSSHKKAKKMKIMVEASASAAADNIAQTTTQGSTVVEASASAAADYIAQTTTQVSTMVAAASAGCGDGPAETKSSGQMMRSSIQISQISSSNTLNIDLNELPIMEDEEYVE